MKAYFKNASWIAPAEPMTVTVFKRCFAVKKIPESALIDITGLGYFELYINGNLVTTDRLIPVASDYFRRDFSVVTYPVRDFFTHRIYFHTFDIAKLLREGENEIKIICGGGWFVQNERIAEGEMGYADRPRCIYELDLGGKIAASDGSEVYTDCEIRETSLFIGEIIDYTYTKNQKHTALTVKSRYLYSLLNTSQKKYYMQIYDALNNLEAETYFDFSFEELQSSQFYFLVFPF